MSDVQTRSKGLLIALLIAHFLLASWYAFNTPYRTPGILLNQRTAEGPVRVADIGAPDERQHANYIQHILDGKGIPVLDPKDPNLGETYQSHQPPFYYILAAGAARVLGVASVEDPGAIRLRLLNALAGAATVAGTFYLGLWGFRRQAVAWGGAVFVALLPMHLALAGAISNDPLLYALCTWVLALGARCLQEGWTNGRAAAIGVMAGLAVLTKTTGIALAPILLFLLAASKPRPDLRQITLGICCYAVLVGPWIARNLRVYGDPFAVNAFNQAFVNSPQASAFIEGFGPFKYWTEWVGWWTARSFFGVFGYMDIFLSEGSSANEPRQTLYRLLLAGMVLVFLGWALATARGDFSSSRLVQAMNALFLATVVMLFLRFNAQYFQGQARYLFPAIAVIGAGVGAASASVRKPAAAVAAVAIVLGGLNAYVIATLPQEFARRTESGGLR
jgi:4-amino-4-deoxy-L-arabinose transferase-like glycosyltransferase